MSRQYGVLFKTTAAGAALAMFAGSSMAFAGDKFSGSMGASYNSHFISYGADVWRGGDDFYGSRSTTFVWGDYNIDFSPVTLNFGFWSDNNNNTSQSLGGNIQEIDVYAGLGYTIDRFSLGATYQAWNYASDTEEVVDLKVGFDDSDLLIDGFALNPKVVWHYRAKGNGAQQVGSAFVVSVAPSFKLTDSEQYPLTLTVPAGVGLFTTDDFQGGAEGGFGYAYAGGSLSMPLSFIPADYGAWSANFDLTYYHTDKDAIPGNPEDDFVTASIGISVAF